MHLPTPIQLYFDADRSDDAHLLLGAFTADAVVHDEGETHTGGTEIAAWWRAAKDKYQHHARPLKVEADGDKVTVKAEVTGNFPGSPAVLNFAFLLAGDRMEVA